VLFSTNEHEFTNQYGLNIRNALVTRSVINTNSASKISTKFQQKMKNDQNTLRGPNFLLRERGGVSTRYRKRERATSVVIAGEKCSSDLYRERKEIDAP
jgi:hypothetical protein